MIFRLDVIDEDKLCRDSDKYDQFCKYVSTVQYVIVAASETDARLMASADKGDDDIDDPRPWWLDPEVTSCVQIGDLETPKIIGRSMGTG